jgi:hypothetical protein
MTVEMTTGAAKATPTTPDRVANGEGSLKAKAAQQRSKKKQAMFRRHVGKTGTVDSSTGTMTGTTTTTTTEEQDLKAAESASPATAAETSNVAETATAEATTANSSSPSKAVAEGPPTPTRLPQLTVDNTTTAEGVPPAAESPGRNGSSSVSPTASSSPINRRRASSVNSKKAGSPSPSRRKAELVKRMFADRNKPKIPPSTTTLTPTTSTDNEERPADAAEQEEIGCTESNEQPLQHEEEYERDAHEKAIVSSLQKATSSEEQPVHEEYERVFQEDENEPGKIESSLQKVASRNDEPDPEEVQLSDEDEEQSSDYVAAVESGIEETKSDVSNGFDMRSIHDYPPSPPSETEKEPEEEEEETAVAEADPTWDTSKAVAFFDDAKVGRTSSRRSSGKSADGLDMFETASWALTNAEFESLPAGANADIEALASRLQEEQAREAKERVLNHGDAAPTPTSSEPSSPKQDDLAECTVEYVDSLDKSEITTKLSIEALSQLTEQHLQLYDAARESEPMWDVTSPLFQQKMGDAKKTDDNLDAINMFDTASWGQADAAFSDVSLSRLAQQQDMEAEFLRLMTVDLPQIGQKLSGDHEGANGVATAGIHEEKKMGDADEGKDRFNPPLKDDEPLLTGANSNLDDSDQRVTFESSEVVLTMEERVLLYTAPPKPDDCSSGVEDDATDPNDGDEDGNFEEGEEVAYIDQASDEEVDGDDIFGIQLVPTPTVSADDAPTFHVAVFERSPHPLSSLSNPDGGEPNNEREPSGKTGRPKVELENLDMINDGSTAPYDPRATESSIVMDLSANSSLMGERLMSIGSIGASTVISGGTTGTAAASGIAQNKRNALPRTGGPPPVPTPPPPPPPPPADNKKKRRSRSKSGGGEKKNIPLLPPPPEEKLKQWEEGKLRAQKHLNALKTGRAPEMVGSSSPVDSARALVLQSALERAAIQESENEYIPDKTALQTDQSRDQEGDLEGPPLLMRKAFDGEFDDHMEMGGVVEAEYHGLFGTTLKSKTSPSKPSAEAGRSQSAGSTILSDQKLAQKVAQASSAAAFKFESVLMQADSNARSPSSAGEKDDIDGKGTVPNALKLVACAPVDIDNIRENLMSMAGSGEGSVGDALLGTPGSKRGGSSDMVYGTRMELVGGAFSPWKNSRFEKGASPYTSRVFLGESRSDNIVGDEERVLWFYKEVLKIEPSPNSSQEERILEIRSLLEEDANFNSMCIYMADAVNTASAQLTEAGTFEELEDCSIEESLRSSESMEAFVKKRPRLTPMTLSEESKKLKPNILAANFVSFLALASKLERVESPFGEENPFLLNLVELSMRGAGIGGGSNDSSSEELTVQQLVLDHSQGRPEALISFVYQVCESSKDRAHRFSHHISRACNSEETDGSVDAQGIPNVAVEPPEVSKSQRTQVFPDGHPSPFESSATCEPRIVVVVLSFLGDPVAVCRMKMVNQLCRRVISENEHMIMRDAVRAGGLSMNVRPAFWMWITLEKCGRSPNASGPSAEGEETCNSELAELERQGREGKWHHVIQRDVTRAFGNMPPHKTGARLRTDSIVRALVTWGKNRIMKRGVKGGGDVMPTPRIGSRDYQKQKGKPQASTSPPPWQMTDEDGSPKSELSQTPTDTVSDWGGVSPVESFAGSMSGYNDGDVESRTRYHRQNSRSTPAEELALSGNALTDDMKEDLQNKLGFILHAMAATHEEVGYCQGMDYVVAHLLRILQDTVKWKYLKGTLPSAIKATRKPRDVAPIGSEDPQRLTQEIAERFLVEETVYMVMDTFFTTYNLRHMYWPELRYLKICCRVFERLIQIKLPVLADHFQHHDLNVGLFALGWFQTLFLYLPSMPSATVCHMWDIWLVERSFKIFFRVGTAILFLSQPILLNHELEGMMTYLNTIPDATLLNPDILIACALNIKVTNSMLTELEEEISRT